VRIVVASLFFGLDLPYVKEFIASIVGVVGFAYTLYRFGRRAGSDADRSRIVTLEDEKSAILKTRDELRDRFIELEQIVKDPRDFWLRSPSSIDLIEH
jgi:hypothetical protein